MKKGLFLASLLFIVFLSFGCAMTSEKSSRDDSGILEPAVMVKFSDIPVPAGFRSVPADSYSFESAGIRVGLLKYQGKADVEQVVNFYKEQMPMFNWNLLNVVEYGQRLLNFERDLETCIVNITARGNNITVTVTLGPKSQNMGRRAKGKEPLK